MKEGDTGPRHKPAPSHWLRLAIVVIALLAVALLGRQAAAYIPRFVSWVQSLGVWGPVAFVAGYAAATVAFVPGSLLTLAAGAVFGIGRGVMYAFAGASIGATLAFLVARYVARGAIERRIAGNPRYAAVDRAVAAQGLKIVTLLRLSPAFPFNALNYALGLTRVRLRDYVVACLGMLPGTLLYVYYGKVAGDVATLAAGAGVRRDAGYWLVLGLGLLATVVVTALVTRTARAALREVADV